MHLNLGDSNAEIDMAILTSTTFEKSDCRREGIWARTKAAEGGDKPTHRIFDFGFDPTEDFHGVSLQLLMMNTTVPNELLLF